MQKSFNNNLFLLYMLKHLTQHCPGCFPLFCIHPITLACPYNLPVVMPAAINWSDAATKCFEKVGLICYLSTNRCLSSGTWVYTKKTDNSNAGLNFRCHCFVDWSFS